MTLKEIISKNKNTESAGMFLVDISEDNFVSTVAEIHESGARLVVMVGEIKPNTNIVRYVFNSHEIYCELQQEVKNNLFKSIYNIFFNALFFENEIHDMFGWVADGNDKQSRLVHHDNYPVDVHPLDKKFAWNTKLEVQDNPRTFRKVVGDGIFEIPVGPVHAGVIEPGHFRFSMAGERIVNIEPMLWFQHKGTEKLFETLDSSKYIQLAERISGDTSVSHTLAHIQAIEHIGNISVPHKAQNLRVIMSEFERIYNHVNDIGFIGQDTGFSVAGANGMQLKEMILRHTEKLTGSRMMRKTLCYGGVNFDITKAQQEELYDFIAQFAKQYREAVSTFETVPTMVNRMETCGIMKHQVAKDYGTVGVPARASGIKTDVRVNHPYDAYKNISVLCHVHRSGDVRARYLVRVEEVYESIKIILEAIRSIDLAEKYRTDNVNITNLTGTSYGITEGWRGEIVHFVAIEKGKITRCKIKDPSFSNWQAMVPTINGNIIGDFPLINKSFNLSYSGNDL